MSPNDLSASQVRGAQHEGGGGTRGEPLVLVSSSHSHLFSPLVAAYGPRPQLELNISVTQVCPPPRPILGGARPLA